MKQVFKLVNLFLVILLVSFTSCTNDLSEKDSQMSFSFTLPQEKVSRTTGDNNVSTLWNVTAVIENKKDIIQKIEQSGYSGETVTITFNQIIIGQKVRINIDLTQDGETTPSYTGSSDWFIVKKDENKINISLNKVTSNENNEPPTIVDAAEPKINVYPTSKVEIATENNSQEELTETLSVNATSTDGGTLSFIWQEKNPDNTWQKFEPITTTTDSDRIESSIKVTVNKGQSRTFKCIITNTNNSVNGNKTATIETNEVTVAYIEGALTSITAQYKGVYETFGSDFTYGNVTVTEKYTNASNNVTTDVTVTAYDSRYTISPTNNDEKAIGFVPYTVSCIYNATVTTNLTVPVKYELNANDFIIKSDTNDNENIGYSENNPEKIPEHTYKTNVTLTAKESLPNFIYETETSEQAIEYDIIKKGINCNWTFKSVNDTNNNANTLTPKDTWCFGEEITLYYYVQVCPWEIALKTEDGNTVDLNILTGGTTYTLSAANEAVANPNVTFSSDTSVFNVRGSTLTTPTANANDQIATITAKVDDTEIGKLNVTVPGIPLGSQGNPFTLWSDLKSYLEVTTSEESTIYVSGNFEATSGITVNRPVTIKPVDEVKIINNQDINLFCVSNNFTLEGTQENNIILDGNGKSNPLIYLLMSNTPTISLKNCTLQNTKDYAMNVYNQNATINIENCTFQNNTTDIYLGKCGDILIINSTFDNVGDKNNIEVINAPSLTLDGTLCIPRIKFENTSNSYNLGIKIGNNLTLKNPDLPITISANNYIGTTYDCNFFELTNGQTLPDGVFALGNEDYILLNNGTITQLGLNASYPFTTWTQLKTYLENNSSDKTEIYVKDNFNDVTSGITVNRPVIIHPVNSSVTISLNSSFNGNLFKVSKDFTLKGTDSNKFILDGNNVQNSDSLITTTSYSGYSIDITLEYVTIKNYTNSSSEDAGGAITFNSKNDTLSLKNCTFNNVKTNYMPDYSQLMIGAICFRDGNLILDSCTFTQDEEYVDLYCYPQNNSTITLKGTIELPIIQYNNSYSSSNGGDLQISLDDTFKSESNIQVYVDNISDGYDTDLFTLNDGQSLPECFTLLNDGYEFDYTNGKIVEKTTGGGGGSGTTLSGTTVFTFDDLKNTVETGTASVIIIGEDIELTNYISIKREVTIAANSNVTLTQPSGSGTTHIFWVTSTGNLTLGGGAGTLTLTGNNNAKEEPIYINQGTLTLKDKCTITGVTNTEAAHAIGIVGGTFNMSGGEISNNTAGTAIYADKDTQASNIEMNIYGGLIYGNKGGANGGALYMGKNSSYSTTVNIYGNVQIYNNTATTYGGSIYMTGSSNKLYVNSHETEENKAAIYDNFIGNTKQGASIYRNGGTFYLNRNSTTEAPYSQDIKP